MKGYVRRIKRIVWNTLEKNSRSRFNCFTVASLFLVLAAIYIGIDLFQMLIEYFLDYYKYTFAQEYNLHLNQV